MRARAITAGLIGLVLACQSFRVALASIDPLQPSSKTVALWPRHPTVLAARAMVGVGEAAAAQQEPGPDVWSKLQLLSREEPLSADPFLVAGALAEHRGDNRKAVVLLEAGQVRRPRSIPAHYLLADLDMRMGRVGEGLLEIADLSRVMPGSSVQIVPALAQFARTPDASRQLARLFAQDPELRAPVLDVLAADPSNAALILSVAGPQDLSGRTPSWQAKLLYAMIAKQDYADAYRIWARLYGHPEQQAAGIFNPSFKDLREPPPFNWHFSSAAAGIAQPSDGSLQVLYYGRDDAALADQLLLLPAGRYRLAATVTGSSGPDGALAWSIACLPSKNQPLAELPLPGSGASRTVAGEFTVPPQGCPAQRLALLGKAEDSPQTSTVQAWPLDLQRLAQ